MISVDNQGKFWYTHINRMNRWVYLLLLVPGLTGGMVFFSTTGMMAEAIQEKGPVIYEGHLYRDPTLNPLLPRAVQEASIVSEAIKLPALSVQGIVWGEDNPQAIIDGRVVAKGDLLPDGVEILDISKKGIKLLYRGKIFTLLPEGEAP